MGFAIGALGLAVVGGPAFCQDYPHDLKTKNPKAFRAWQGVAPREYLKQDWIGSLSGVAGPMQSVTMQGRAFYYGSVCIPHDCGGNFVAFLIARDGSSASGALSSKTLGVPRRYFGAPDAEARRRLAEKLAE